MLSLLLLPALLISPAAAQLGFSNLVFSVGTTINSGGTDWSFLWLDSLESHLLAGKRFAVFAKPGHPGDSGAFVQRATVFQQTDPAAVNSLLQQSVALNDDLSSLNNALDVLLARAVRWLLRRR